MWDVLCVVPDVRGVHFLVSYVQCTVLVSLVEVEGTQGEG